MAARRGWCLRSVFLEVLADPEHPEHADRLEWIGRPFDPRAFDINDVNARLNARQ